MDIVNSNLDKVGFKHYLADYHFGAVPPKKIVLHHTWKPTQNTWSGQASIDGLKRYYEGRGWSAAPHIFIGEDGIWLFTAMNRVGIHAGNGNATYWDKILKRDVKGFIGVLGNGNWRYILKKCSIGIEMVGNYDLRRPSGKTWDNTLFVLNLLKSTLGLEYSDIKFHNDYSSKSCPGATVTKEWVYKEMEAYGKPPVPLPGVPPEFKGRLKWNGKNSTLNQVVDLLYQYHQKFHP